VKKPRPKHRVEVHSGPDSLGRYSYTLFWEADYHPGHPEGENRRAERGQCFFGPLPTRSPRAPRAKGGTP
jgi:hypothetical protein